MAELKESEYLITSKSERLRFEYNRRKSAIGKGSNYRKDLANLTLFLHGNDLYQGAMLAYQALIRDDPDDAKWPYLYARILQDHGAMEQALEMLDRSIALDPGYALSYLKKADLMSKLGSRELAVEAYHECLRRDPSIAHASLGLARMAIEDGELEIALNRLDEAIEKDPQLSSSYFLLATVYDQWEQPELAEKNRMLGTAHGRFRDPEDPWAEMIYEHCFDAYKLSVIADTYAKTHRVEQALSYFDRAYELDPDNASLCFTIAQTYLKAGNREKGMEYLDRSLLLDPSDGNTYIAKAAELAIAGDYRKALAVIDKGLELAGPTGFLYRQKGILLGALGDNSGMELMYLKAVKTEPDNVKCNITLANHLWSIGSKESAVFYYQHARKLSILEIKPRAVLASYHLDRDAFEEAAACVKEIEDIEPEFEGLKDLKKTLFLNRGNAAFHEQQWEKAETCFRKALETDGSSEEALNNLVTVLLRTERSGQAMKLIQQQLSDDPSRLFLFRLAVGVSTEQQDRVNAIYWLKQGMQKAEELRDKGSFDQFARQLEILETPERMSETPL